MAEQINPQLDPYKAATAMTTRGSNVPVALPARRRIVRGRRTGETARPRTSPESVFYVGSFALSPGASPAAALRPATTASLSRGYEACFGVSLRNLEFLPPSRLYLASTDPSSEAVIAAAALTARRPSSVPPRLWSAGRSYYLFSVCTDPAFRGLGIMRDLLTRIASDIQGVVGEDGAELLLEVLPTNEPAYRLYRGLGFAPVATAAVTGERYDVLLLPIPGASRGTR